MYIQKVKVQKNLVDLDAERRERTKDAEPSLVCPVCGKEVGVGELYIKEWLPDGSKAMACLSCCSKK